MWVLLELPQFGGANHASGYHHRSRHCQVGLSGARPLTEVTSPRTRRPGAYPDAILVPEVRWILRQSVEIYSVLHRLCSMLCQRLSTVTWLTQALPVAAIPEQPEISIVRYDVIHLCG